MSRRSVVGGPESFEYFALIAVASEEILESDRENLLISKHGFNLHQNARKIVVLYVTVSKVLPARTSLAGVW